MKREGSAAAVLPNFRRAASLVLTRPQTARAVSLMWMRYAGVMSAALCIL
jgi:hypothetical protein